MRFCNRGDRSTQTSPRTCVPLAGDQHAARVHLKLAAPWGTNDGVDRADRVPHLYRPAPRPPDSGRQGSQHTLRGTPLPQVRAQLAFAHDRAKARLVVPCSASHCTSTSLSLQAAPHCRPQRRSGRPAHNTARKQWQHPPRFSLKQKTFSLLMSKMTWSPWRIASWRVAASVLAAWGC